MTIDELDAAFREIEDDELPEAAGGSYAYTAGGVKKVPLDTPGRVRAALSMLENNWTFRGNKLDVPDSAKAGIAAKIRAAAKRLGIKAKGDDKKTKATESDPASFDGQADRIRTAWANYAEANPLIGASSYPTEVFPDRVIARIGQDHHSVPFDDDGDEIAFHTDKAKKVSQRWVPEALDIEEAELTPIAEADGEPDGSEWNVTIIKTGTSKNGRRYPEKTLKEAAPLFEGARVLARADEDHISGKGKSVTNLVGWLSDVKYEKGALRGRLSVSEAASWLRTMLLDAWRRGKKDLVGLSIVAEGRGKAVTEQGKRVFEVEALTKVSSVDVVFDPAAGGGLVKLVAATGEESDVDPKLIEALSKADTSVFKALVANLAEADVAQIKEAHPELVAKIDEALKPEEPAPDPDKKVTETETKVPAYMASILVEAELNRTKLPEITRKKISKRFESGDFEVSELKEAISDEVDTWAELEKQGLVKSKGQTRNSDSEVGVEEAERAKAALDGLIAGKDVEIDGEKIPRYRGLREAYLDLTGDEQFTGMLPNRPAGKLGLSVQNMGMVQFKRHEIRAGALEEALDAFREGKRFDRDSVVTLSEAISVGGFNTVLGDSVTRQMVREYLRPDLMIWDPLVDIVPLSDYRTQRRERYGGYANLPTVSENGPYNPLASPTNEEATYSPAKRGGTEVLSMEAIRNDDIGALQRIPTRLGRGAAQTLHEFVLDFLNTNPTIYDSIALFNGSHNNTATTALSLASLSASRQRMRKQAEKDNAKRLGFVPKWLWVPIELEQLAFELTNSELKPATDDNDQNFIRSWGMEYRVVDYWTDTNNWYVSADKSSTPIIELGFLGGQQEPELFVQDMPNVGSMFTNDQLTYKIRHQYGAAVIDFRGLDGSLV